MGKSTNLSLQIHAFTINPLPPTLRKISLIPVSKIQISSPTYHQTRIHPAPQLDIPSEIHRLDIERPARGAYRDIHLAQSALLDRAGIGPNRSLEVVKDEVDKRVIERERDANATRATGVAVGVDIHVHGANGACSFWG